MKRQQDRITADVQRAADAGQPPWLNWPACCELPMTRSPVAVTVPAPVTARPISPVAASVAPLETVSGPPPASPLGRTSVPWLTAIGPLVTLIELNVSCGVTALAHDPRAVDRPGVGAVCRLVEHQRGVVGNAPLQADGRAPSVPALTVVPPV